MGEALKVYCLFDSDYHLEQDVARRFSEASNRKILLHVWNHKEIENYALNSDAIARVLKSRSKRGGKYPGSDEIYDQILRASDEMRTEIVRSFAQSLLESNPGLGMKAHELAEAWVAERWEDEARRVSMVPGKQILSRLSKWTQQQFGLSFGPVAVARAMRSNEIPSEATRLISAIEHGHKPPDLATDRFAFADKAHA